MEGSEGSEMTLTVANEDWTQQAKSCDPDMEGSERFVCTEKQQQASNFDRDTENLGSVL